MNRTTWQTSDVKEGATLALASASVVLTWIIGWDDTSAIGMRTVAYLLLGFTSSIGSKTYRWLCVGLGLLGLAQVAGNVFSISSPFSDSMTGLISIVASIMLLIGLSALFIREHVAPTSEDFRAIERAHKERKRQEREQREGIS